MSIIQKEFVRRVLQDEGERLTRNQGIRIAKQLQFRTGRLENDRRTQVVQSEGMDGTLQFTHPDYERFLDMKQIVSRKRSRLIRQRQNKGARQSIRSTGYRKKGGYGIHNRYVFGHYDSIARRLMYEFTADVAEGIRREFFKNQ